MCLTPSRLKLSASSRFPKTVFVKQLPVGGTKTRSPPLPLSYFDSTPIGEGKSLVELQKRGPPLATEKTERGRLFLVKKKRSLSQMGFCL